MREQAKLKNLRAPLALICMQHAVATERQVLGSADLSSEGSMSGQGKICVENLMVRNGDATWKKNHEKLGQKLETARRAMQCKPGADQGKRTSMYRTTKSLVALLVASAIVVVIRAVVVKAPT